MNRNVDGAFKTEVKKVSHKKVKNVPKRTDMIFISTDDIKKYKKETKNRLEKGSRTIQKRKKTSATQKKFVKVLKEPKQPVNFIDKTEQDDHQWLIKKKVIQMIGKSKKVKKSRPKTIDNGNSKHQTGERLDNPRPHTAGHIIKTISSGGQQIIEKFNTVKPQTNEKVVKSKQQTVEKIITSKVQPQIGQLEDEATKKHETASPNKTEGNTPRPTKKSGKKPLQKNPFSTKNTQEVPKTANGLKLKNVYDTSKGEPRPKSRNDKEIDVVFTRVNRLESSEFEVKPSISSAKESKTKTRLKSHDNHAKSEELRQELNKIFGNESNTETPGRPQTSPKPRINHLKSAKPKVKSATFQPESSTIVMDKSYDNTRNWSIQKRNTQSDSRVKTSKQSESKRSDNRIKSNREVEENKNIELARKVFPLNQMMADVSDNPERKERSAKAGQQKREKFGTV